MESHRTRSFLEAGRSNCIVSKERIYKELEAAIMKHYKPFLALEARGVSPYVWLFKPREFDLAT
jgi:hypothetical protein